MRYLLDTHILIWALFDPTKLSEKVQQILSNPINMICVSSVDFWEISIKFRTGKIGLGDYLPSDLPKICQQIGFELIDLSSNETGTFYQINADYHKDPFDRILIWQAITNDFTLISDDENVKKYVSEGLKVVW